MEAQDWVLSAQAAEITGVTTRHLANLVEAGRLRRRKSGRKVEYYRPDLETYAGRETRDPRDMRIGELERELGEKEAALTYQKEKFESFQERRVAELREKNAEIDDLKGQILAMRLERVMDVASSGVLYPSDLLRKSEEENQRLQARLARLERQRLDAKARAAERRSGEQGTEEGLRRLLAQSYAVVAEQNETIARLRAWYDYARQLESRLGIQPESQTTPE